MMLFKEIKRTSFIEPISLVDKLANVEINAEETTILTCSQFDIKKDIDAQISNRAFFDYEHYFEVAYPSLVLHDRYDYFCIKSQMNNLCVVTKQETHEYNHCEVFELEEYEIIRRLGLN